MSKRNDMPDWKELVETAFNVIKSSPEEELHYTEIDARVCKQLNLSDEILDIPPRGWTQCDSEIKRRISYCRTYLKTAKLIEQRGNGYWSISEAGADIDNIAGQDVMDLGSGYIDYVKEKTEEKVKEYLNLLIATLTNQRDYKYDGTPLEVLVWFLLQVMDFEHVGLTRRSNDHGVDVVATFKGNEIVRDRHIIFQCKQWNAKNKGEIDKDEMLKFIDYLPKLDDYDEAVFITTGTYSKEAREEAEKKHIRLIDGMQLTRLLLKYQVFFKHTEDYIVDPSWVQQMEYYNKNYKEWCAEQSAAK